MIRRGSIVDVAAVVTLERAVATAPHWAVGEYEGMFGVNDSLVRRVMFVAEEDGVVGFAVGKVLAGEGEVESVVVRESARRRGVGGALCREVMTWCVGEGVTKVVLEVREGSAGAKRLYERLGFVEVGRRHGYYDRPHEDAVLMRCALRGVERGRKV